MSLLAFRCYENQRVLVVGIDFNYTDQIVLVPVLSTMNVSWTAW